MATLIAYIPALHKGYIDFFKKHKGELLILGKDLVLEHPRMERDIRAIDPQEMLKLVNALGIFKRVHLLTQDNLRSELQSVREIIMPDEDLSHTIAERYFKNKSVQFQNIFLRWDKIITLQELEVSPDRIISRSEFDKKIMKQVSIEAEKSPDWWRWNGALVLKEGKIILSGHNKHMPTNHNPNVFGDPRSNFDAGEQPDIYTSIHAEASVIAQAAKQGISLKGTAMYMTTFPCSVCARSIVESGIREVYYLKGYSRLDAEQLLKQHDVKIIMVKLD